MERVISVIIDDIRFDGIEIEEWWDDRGAATPCGRRLFEGAVARIERLSISSPAGECHAFRLYVDGEPYPGDVTAFGIEGGRLSVKSCVGHE